MKSESFYGRAHESRTRLTQESGLGSDPGKFESLRSVALDIQHAHIEQAKKVTSPGELGKILDSIALQLQDSFPNDTYGEVARATFLKRVFEKARDEIGDWLIEQGEGKLTEELKKASGGWITAKEAGIWIQQHVLVHFDDQSLFAKARDAKVDESEAYYIQEKGLSE